MDTNVFIRSFWVDINIICLGAIHNCQHLNESTKHILSQTPPPPPPPQKVYTSTFFKWIIYHENYCKKKRAKMFKEYRINIIFQLKPPLKEYVLYIHFTVDNYGFNLPSIRFLFLSYMINCSICFSISIIHDKLLHLFFCFYHTWYNALFDFVDVTF